MRNQIDLRFALLPDDFAGLEALAVATDSVAERGRGVGSPSWRSLVRRIAAGDLLLVDPASGLVYRADPGFAGQVLAGGVSIPATVVVHAEAGGAELD